MLVFIDESGHPHPNDPNKCPVVVAVCIAETDARSISGRLHALKRDMLGSERMELKAVNILNRRTYGRKPQYREFIEELFSAIMNLPLTVFAITMQSPFPEAPNSDNLILPERFRFLLQRIELLAEQRDEMATIMFDGSPNLYGGISLRFNSFLYRSEEGRACSHITDAPSFVDSKASAGIQIADVVASVIRQFQEAGLFQSAPPAEDGYLFAIRRWYRIVEGKTRNDLVSHDGSARIGIYHLPQGVS